MKKFRNFIDLKIEDVNNAVVDVRNGFNESSLEEKITELLKIDFRQESRDKCINLIKDIIELSIKTEVHQKWSGLQNEVKKNAIQGKRLGNEANTAVTQAKDLNAKYLKWELGDAQKIYDALKSATDGKITNDVIESLASDSLVKSFFEMIFTYIKHKLNLATESELKNVKAMYHAGPLMKKVHKVENTKHYR